MNKEPYKNTEAMTIFNLETRKIETGELRCLVHPAESGFWLCAEGRVEASGISPNAGRSWNGNFSLTRGTKRALDMTAL